MKKKKGYGKMVEAIRAKTAEKRIDGDRELVGPRRFPHGGAICDPGCAPVQRSRGRFFSQAEDGIRDPLVTGVQTCALPISSLPIFCPATRKQRRARRWRMR